LRKGNRRAIDYITDPIRQRIGSAEWGIIKGHGQDCHQKNRAEVILSNNTRRTTVKFLATASLQFTI
jgi:hypothetical protein